MSKDRSVIHSRRKPRDDEQHQVADIFPTQADKMFRSVNNILVVLVVLIVFIPLINVLASSFSSASAVNSGRVYLWPVEFTLAGYDKVFSYPNVWTSYANTIYYTLVGTAINLAMTLLAAYPLSRNEMPLQGFFMFMFTLTMMFSGGMIPSYLVMKKIGITSTRWAMVLPGAISVTNMIIARTFIRNIPDELREAAMIDGCSYFKYFTAFVLPLSTTMLAVLMLYYAVGHWNDYFKAFLYLSDRRMMPLQVLLREVLISSRISQEAVTDSETEAALAGLSDLLKYSMIVVSSVPMLCLYPFLQKFFIKGVMIGSLKG